MTLPQKDLADGTNIGDDEPVRISTKYFKDYLVGMDGLLESRSMKIADYLQIVLLSKILASLEK